MTKNGTAGVFQLDNGNWGYHFIVTVNGVRKAQKRVRDERGLPYKTKNQAVKARTLAIRVEKERLQVRREEMQMQRKTVAEVYAEYCEKGRCGKAYATKKKQDCLWNNYLKERFGERYIDEISVAEVNDYLAELYCVRRLAYGYVEGFLKWFYLLFGQAYARNDLSLEAYHRLCVAKNGRIQMPRKRSTDVKEIAAYTRQEMEQMDVYFRGRPVETAYMIGKYCGLRIAECYGLTWDCVDLERGTILVEKQLKVQEGLIKLVPLKTLSSRRTVYMHRELREYLMERKEQRRLDEVTYAAQREQNERMIYDIDGKKISSLLLVNTLPNGKIQTEWAIKHHAKALREQYRITFKYHTLRHTYGTRLAMLNTPAHVLADQMGHGKVSTTHKYYLAMSEEVVRELKSKLDRM